MLAQITAWLLRRKKLSVKDKTVLLNAILDTIKAIPLQSLVAQDTNRNIYVMGKRLNDDEAFKLRENAGAVLRSNARKLVQDQVRFAAIDQGYLKSDDPTAALFFKAALWYAQEENAVLEKLADTPVDI